MISSYQLLINKSRNLVDYPFFACSLNKLGLWQDLMLKGKSFQSCAPRKVKLCKTKESLVLHLLILSLLSSSFKYFDRYSGSPYFLILKTIQSVWYTTSWRIDIKPTLSKRVLPGILQCALHTILAALFWRICNSFNLFFSQPPNKGRQ